ncbi:HAD family hydrolase [Microbacterium sp. NPDC090218]
MSTPMSSPVDPRAERPSAVLFDLDGTLVDSERLWLDAVRSRLGEAGRTVSPALLAQFEGLTTLDSARTLIEVGGLDAHETVIAAELEQLTIDAFAGRLSWIPGAEEALSSLRRAGTPLALVTSSTRRWVAAVTENIPLGPFAVVVTVDDVEHAKPDAEPYLRATGLLGIDPGACLVFEDSSVGVRAAVAAGCRVVQVRPDHHDATCDITTRIPDLRPVTAGWVASQLTRTPTLL